MQGGREERTHGRGEEKSELTGVKRVLEHSKPKKSVTKCMNDGVKSTGE
jgi:hypothetical protein